MAHLNEQATEMVAYYERALGREREDLVRRMRQLAERLVSEADALESDANAYPNSIGVVQGSGCEIDNLIGKIVAHRDDLATMRQMIVEVAS